MKQSTKELIDFIGCILILAVTLLFLSGCTKKVYVPTERTVMRTDTCFQTRLRVDSVILRDSIAVIQKGDTVYYTKYRDRFKVRERVDTVYRAVSDSVRVSVPYPVERELTKWERVKQDVGGMAIGGLIAAVLAAVIVWIVKRKRRR